MCPGKIVISIWNVKVLNVTFALLGWCRVYEIPKDRNSNHGPFPQRARSIVHEYTAMHRKTRYLIIPTAVTFVNSTQ